MSFRATKGALGPKKKALERTPVILEEETKGVQDQEEGLDDEVSQESVYLRNEEFQNVMENMRAEIQRINAESVEQFSRQFAQHAVEIAQSMM